MFADVAFLLELVEGGPYGGTADMKPLGEISFDDPGSGREFAVHDELSKLLERRRNTGAVHEFESACLRLIVGSGRGHRRDFSVRRDQLWIVRSIIALSLSQQNSLIKMRNCIQLSHFLMPPYPSVQVIDSHTAGEPTRVVIDGGPDLGCGPLTERLARFRDTYDYFRQGVVNEPRGSDVVVGAILLEPFDRTCKAAVIYFNNVGYLGMCGHGTIGLVRTLEHMGRIEPGEHRIETPSGVVTTTLHPSGQVTVENVPAYRVHKGVLVDVPGYGAVTGDVAWGGNWFFLASVPGLSLALANVVELSRCAQAIKAALADSRITGTNGGEIDHIELFGAPKSLKADSRNFVLCPGNAYDRSPCGTGTSAKMACLHADGHLVPGKIWRQEGILGTYFDGSIAVKDGQVIPSIAGEAYITGEARLFFMEKDPFRWGIM
jgi:4-hydroxyproline epimerase